MDFWEFFLLLVVFIPLAIIWVAAVFDLFRRHDISGWAKAAWLVLVIVLPLIGVVIYLIARPSAPAETTERKVPYDDSVARDLRELDDLRKTGSISDDEFAVAKADVLRNRTLG